MGQNNLKPQEISIDSHYIALVGSLDSDSLVIGIIIGLNDFNKDSDVSNMRDISHMLRRWCHWY